MASQEVLIATKFNDLKNEKDRLAKLVKANNEKLNATGQELIDYMVEEGKSSTGQIS